MTMQYLYRQKRIQRRISLLAAFALLWSQLAMAGHAVCLIGDVEARTGHPAVSEPCDESESTQSATCELHCAQADLSFEVLKVHTVPALANVWPYQWPTRIGDNTETERPSIPPAESWHRPTAHPASLLLI